MFFSGGSESVTLFFTNDLNYSAMEPEQLSASGVAVGCSTGLYWKMST